MEAAHHIDAVAHESLQRMHQKEVTSTRHRALTSRLLATLLSIVGDTYEERARSFQWRLTGPFSALELGDLPQLARRSEPMRKKYGDKQVETIFEQQLALLMQSLGFVVVQTRRGRRTVDLVAIADGPDDRFTFLVEAKTTAASTYPFPADDQRALAEYARSVRSTLTTMPTMRFVLLISHTASRTMPEKVTAFEAAHPSRSASCRWKSSSPSGNSCPGLPRFSLLVRRCSRDRRLGARIRPLCRRSVRAPPSSSQRVRPGHAFR